MICACIKNKTFTQIQAILDTVAMAEIRLDLCPGLTPEQIETLFASDVPLIATCRAGASVDTTDRESRLMAAIRGGAHYVDLDIDDDPQMARRLTAACARYGTNMIRSYHNFEQTPSLDQLRRMVDRCRHADAQVVKIATVARCGEDEERVMSLYRYYTPESLIAFTMNSERQGEDLPSRIDCLRKGAPFSYASLDGDDEAVAPGQIPYTLMSEMVYGGKVRFIGADVHMPCSKSYAQRAIVSAALSEGTSVLRGYTPCGDSDAALDVARQLGASVRLLRGPSGTDTVEITGIGGAVPGAETPENGVGAPENGAGAPEDGAETPENGAGAPEDRAETPENGAGAPEDGAETPENGAETPENGAETPENGVGAPESGAGAPGDGAAHPESGARTIMVGESGLLARLMIPLAAQLYPEGAVIRGRGTLSTRVMDGAVDVIRSLGAEISGNKVPLSVKGPIAGGYTVLDGSRTSQIVSGLMMALPLGRRSSTLSVRDPASIPYLYMTMEMLRKFGVKVRAEMFAGRHYPTEDWSKCNEILLKIRENQSYKAASVDLEGDWSAAAVFLVAGAVFGQVNVSGLDTHSIQADLSILDILMDAGASVSQLDEPRGLISVRRSPLYYVCEDLSNCPDLFPAVSVMCAFCEGKSILRGVHRLRHKESDRADGILRMLTALGVRACLSGDDLVISGESLASRCLGGRLLRGGHFSSDGDHRMAMALRLASLGASSPVVVDDCSCVAKSFPEFNDLWDKTICNEYIR